MSHDLASATRDLDLDDDDPFASPAPREKRNIANLDGQAGSGLSRYDTEDVRQASLQKELDSVKSVNRVVENIIASLEKSRRNMETVHDSVSSASTLLNTWTRILSQTEHNQRLILNPNWHGATQDMEDIENESMLRQQAAERKAVEEQARRDALARAAEEEERRKASATTATRGTRGRVRSSGYGRGSSTASTTSSVGSTRGRGTARGASGIGRAATGSRGRGRGLG